MPSIGYFERKRVRNKERIRKKRLDPLYKEMEKKQRIEKMSTQEEKDRRKKYKKTEKGKIVNDRYKNSEKGRAAYLRSHLKRRYNMTIEDYNNMLENQNYYCGLCGNQLTGKIVVDHNHSTGKVRAIIHQKCNIILGVLNDRLDLLKKTETYLLKHSE